MGSTLRWTVGGERMDYLSEVRSETLSGCSTGHGSLGKLVEENQFLREHVAERNAIIETLKRERDEARAHRDLWADEVDRQKAKVERLTTGICAPEIRPTIGAGYVRTPSADFDTCGTPIRTPLTASPLRCGGIHLDAPAGSTITITLPKD